MQWTEDSGQLAAMSAAGRKLQIVVPAASGRKICPLPWPICAVRVRIGVCVRMCVMIPSMVCECGPWTGDRGINFCDATGGGLPIHTRTRLWCARGGRATPHPGDHLEPALAVGPEPAIALAPHPAVPRLTARPLARPMGLQR